MFSAKVNDNIVSIRRDYVLNDKTIDKKYLYYILLDFVNNIRNMIFTSVCFLFFLFLYLADYFDLQIFKNLNITFWGSVISTVFSVFLIWYTTKISEQKRYINDSVREMLFDLLTLYEANQNLKAIYKFGMNDEVNNFKAVEDMLDHVYTDDEEKATVNKRKEKVEYMLLDLSKKYISISFRNYNPPIKFAVEEIQFLIDHRNNLIKKTDLSIDDYYQLIQRFDPVKTRLEKLLRSSL